MLVDLLIPAVLPVIMLSLGLRLWWHDFARVARAPKAFDVGAFNQILLLSIIGFAIAVCFGLPPELAVGTMVLAPAAFCQTCGRAIPKVRLSSLCR